jgi:hypothetical protein
VARIPVIRLPAFRSFAWSCAPIWRTVIRIRVRCEHGHGEEVAQKTAASAGDAASETVKETGQQQAKEMAESQQV